MYRPTILELDVDTVAELVPRITSPMITEELFDELDITATMSIGYGLLGFFPGVGEQVKKLLDESPTT